MATHPPVVLGVDLGTQGVRVVACMHRAIRSLTLGARSISLLHQLAVRSKTRRHGGAHFQPVCAR